LLSVQELKQWKVTEFCYRLHSSCYFCHLLHKSYIYITDHIWLWALLLLTVRCSRHVVKRQKSL